MLSIAISQISNFQYPNIIYTIADNSFYIGMIFGACGVLGELENNNKIHSCLKTNLKLASNFFIISSLIHLYRINSI